MVSRRGVLQGGLAAVGALLAPAGWTATPAARSAEARLRALESGAARLGVCVLDTASGAHFGHRLDEHFALCSTFKLALAAACLREADHGRLDLSEVLPYAESDLLEWAPVTREHLAEGGLSIGRLAQAAQEISDGTAANLLVRRLGGPAGVTARIRDMGDSVTRLDRYEPDLGLVLSADLRDTTTPVAMAQLVQRITTGDLLQPDSRDQLLGWMRNTRTGLYRLRAGLPEDWLTGNKTGTGRAEGTTNKCNDIAITVPPGRSPVVIAAYYDSGEYTPQVERRHEAVLAEVARIAAAWVRS
ncbi:class A beta-lactamase [Aquimonas voraii]|uniref:Beta-lactamase n=1 Tax=Aquimonas voraii TaxID=265719 RepID=A0A1G6WVT0_9GAMM|nr:class A beta-lactamase [Aquimonas voraii]SDD70002.1 beta-lactamase class A [Aquimonas voraii]